MKVKILIICTIIPLISFSQTWTSTREISHGNQVLLPSYANAKCIAVESENIVHTVWMDNVDNNFEIYYARSIDYGTTWSSPQRLTETEPNSICPAIAISETYVHVVWIEETGPLFEGGKIYLKRSLDSGVSWEHEILLAGEDDYQYPSITADELSNINVVWLHNEYLPKIKAKHSLDNGAHWDTTLTVYTGGPPATNEILGKPTISAEGNGCPRVHIAVNRHREGEDEDGETGRTKILYVRSSDYGYSWETPYLIPNTSVIGPSTELSIMAYDSDIHIVYSYALLLGEFHDRQAWVYWIYGISSLDGGNSWGERSTLYSSVTYVDPLFPLPRPSIGFDKAHLPHVTWSEWSFSDELFGIYYTKSFSQGNIWETPIRFTTECSRPQRLSLNCYKEPRGKWNANNGIYLMWTEIEEDIYKIYFKRGWQIGANATYPNQGRHLDRTINTDISALAFQGENALFWQSTERTEVCSPVGLCDGKQPSIAVTAGSSSWVNYIADIENEQHLKYRIKRSEDPYDWKELEVWRAENIYAPALALAIGIEATPENMGYVVYTVKENDNTYIYFSAFDSLREEPYYTTVLDRGEGDISVLAPSISLTPGDLIHIVWQKTEQNGEISRIYYITTRDEITPDAIRNGAQPTWSDIVQISREGHTEPASNPSVEAFGKYVYAAWRGPNEEGNPAFGDIWRRARSLGDPYNVWQDPRNMSETREQESNYPVMSTDFVTVWQEQIDNDNWEIYAKFEPEQSAQPIFETPTPSKYPHINGYWDPNPALPPTFCVNTIWTEEFAPELFEVKFDCYRYEYNPNPEEKANLYYTVEIGDTVPSPLCSQRDGYLRYGQYKIDYGNQKLKYKLLYLHPSYYYDLRAIVYQQGQDNWTQKFDIDSTFSTSVTFEPNRPETVWIRLPQQAYMNDNKVKYDVKKIFGNRAVIADLRLYQKEEFISSGGGQQSANNTLIKRPILYQSFPNPFKSHTAIRYSLPAEKKVMLSIYDVSGRLVKTVINHNQTSGIYSVSWDGKDDKGRTVAQGIYFYRLQTDNFSDTKRLVFIK